MSTAHHSPVGPSQLPAQRTIVFWLLFRQKATVCGAEHHKQELGHASRENRTGPVTGDRPGLDPGARTVVRCRTLWAYHGRVAKIPQRPSQNIHSRWIPGSDETHRCGVQWRCVLRALSMHGANFRGSESRTDIIYSRCDEFAAGLHWSNWLQCCCA